MVVLPLIRLTFGLMGHKHDQRVTHIALHLNKFEWCKIVVHYVVDFW